MFINRLNYLQILLVTKLIHNCFFDTTQNIYLYFVNLVCQSSYLVTVQFFRRNKVVYFHVFFIKWAKPGLFCLFLFFSHDKYSTNLKIKIKVYMVCLGLEPRGAGR